MRKSVHRNIAQQLLSGLIAGSSLPGALAVGIALTATMPRAAQAASYTTVDLNGHVTSDKGQAIPSATITITSDQGVVRTTTADASGQFRLPALPIGAYRATVSAAGFTPLSDRAIALAPGSSTLAFTLSPEGTVLDEVVVSAARVIKDFNKTDGGIAMDVQEIAERVPLARNINAAVMLSPSVSVGDASIIANGVRRNQNAVNIAGTSAAESVYYINGLNVTDQRYFLGYSDLPFEMIQTIEVKTGGYQAEFGRGTGGIVNIVTRSGSNEFHWGASAYWTPNSLRETRSTSYAPGGNNSVGIIDLQETVKSNLSEQTIWASGPLVEDHLFIFGLYNARQTNNWNAARFLNPSTNNGTWQNTVYNDPRWATKIDFVLNENHRLEATLFSDAENTDYRPWNYGKAENAIVAVPGVSNPDGSLLPYQQEAGGMNSILQYTGVLSPHVTLSALVGRSRSNYKDSGPYITTPGVQDFGTTGSFVTLGRHAGPFNLEGEDTRDTWRLDGDFYFSAAGDHHLRVGYDYEELLTTATSAYSGGALYYGLETGDCPGAAGAAGCVEKLTFANVGDFNATQSAWYVQDSWSLTPNFTLQLGLRGDIYDYKNVNGESYIKITDQIAPRLGFSWDPTGSGLNRIYGSFGDYYLPIATNTSVRASSGEVFSDQYFQTQRDVDGNLVIDSAGYPIMGTQLAPTDYFSPPGAPDRRSVIEADLNPMYEREFALGFEHEFSMGALSGWRTGIRYTHRELQSTIEDTAIGDAVARYCNRNGISCVAADGSSSTDTDASDFVGLFPYVLINPGDGARVYVDLQGDSRTDAAGVANPAYNPQWIDLTAGDLALEEVIRQYHAVELSLERPWNGKWSLQASYVWSHSYGNYEGAVKSDVAQTDTSITQDFDHHANTLYSYGDLPNDRRHTLKLNGNWGATDKLSFGTNLTVQSGKPYGCIGYVPQSVDPLAPDSATPSGWYCPRGSPLPNATGTLATQMAALGQPALRYTNVPTPRASQGRTDWLYTLDLSAAYTLFQSADRGKAVARLDIFNVLDGDSVVRVVEQGEVRTGAGSTKNVAAPFYGLPRQYQAPRTVRFGISYSY